jgi:hypothetical protein
MKKLAFVFSLAAMLLPSPASLTGQELYEQVPTLDIAAFDLQDLGPEKIADTANYKKILRILNNFEIVALQGLRCEDQKFLSVMLPDLGPDWQGVAGPRMGAPDSKEQLAFVWKKHLTFDSTALLPGVTEAVITKTLEYRMDEEELQKPPMKVMPFAVGFRVENKAAGYRCDFILVNVKVDSGRTADELKYLNKFYGKMLKIFEPEKDLVLLGNFNAPNIVIKKQLDFKPVLAIDPDAVTDRRAKTGVDNIVISTKKGFSHEFNPIGDVFKLTDELGIPEETALRISAHQPVYIWLEWVTRDDD